jgi:hypothetical protein
VETGILILVLAMCASFVQRTIGFGFGVFIMTMLPLLMPSFAEATALSGLLAMITSTIVTVKLRKDITWKRLLPVLGVFLIVSSAAIFLLPSIHEKTVRIILGVILVLLGLYFALIASHIHLHPTLNAQIGAGAVSGVMGGFFAIQGPPMALYFLASEPDKEHYLAMISAFLLISNLCMTAVRAANGFLTTAVGEGFLWGVVGVAIGTSLGAWVFKRIPRKFFRYLVYGYIALSGIIILVNTLS